MDTSYLEELDFLDPNEVCNRISGADLHATISNGDFKAFEEMLKKGAPMEAKNIHGLTPLHVVCVRQEVEMVTSLLRAGCQGIYLLPVWLCGLTQNVFSTISC